MPVQGEANNLQAFTRIIYFDGRFEHRAFVIVGLLRDSENRIPRFLLLMIH